MSCDESSLLCGLQALYMTYPLPSLHPSINTVLSRNIPGMVSTIAGSSEGFADGKDSAAKFICPRGVAIDSDGSYIVADTGNNRIRRVTRQGTC